MIDRRRFGLGLGATLLLPACSRAAAPEKEARSAAQVATLAAALTALGSSVGGRLGVYVLDTGSGAGAGWNEGERFGLCSTFKLSLAALVLREAAAGRLSLDEEIAYSRADLIAHAPETEKHLAAGRMTIGALAEAAQITSDNTAANLLLRRLGGPAALTRFWREIGDGESRLDRFEPELNRVPPGELRDTTTPEAMARGVARFVLGDGLDAGGKAKLVDWMARTTTGMKRIRAAVPATWRAGDKTGTASYPGIGSKINDIAVLTPPGGRAPLVVTAFYEAADTSGTMRAEDEAVLKRVGETVVAWAG